MEENVFVLRKYTLMYNLEGEWSPACLLLSNCSGEKKYFYRDRKKCGKMLTLGNVVEGYIGILCVIFATSQ